MKKQRQCVVQIFLYGVKVMIAAVLQVEHIMLRCKDVAAEHLIGHVDRLDLHRVVGADGVIDEIAALVEAVILHQLPE